MFFIDSYYTRHSPIEDTPIEVVTSLYPNDCSEAISLFRSLSEKGRQRPDLFR